VLPLLAFYRFCDIILAVHSDCPPLEKVVSNFILQSAKEFYIDDMKAVLNTDAGIETL